MNDQEIKEAVEIFKQFEKLGRLDKHLQVLLNLAQAYLKVKCPEKKEIGEIRYGGCNPDEDRGYNQALDDYRLWLTKRLNEENLVRTIKQSLVDMKMSEILSNPSWNGVGFLYKTANAIIKMMSNQ